MKAKVGNWAKSLLVSLMVLPAAGVAAFIVLLLFPILTPSVGRLWASLALALLMPVAFIGVGAWAARSSKFRVAVVLAIFVAFALVRGYWTTGAPALIQPSASDPLVQSIALNVVGIVAALYLVRRLSRPTVQYSV